MRDDNGKMGKRHRNCGAPLRNLPIALITLAINAFALYVFVTTASFADRPVHAFGFPGPLRWLFYFPTLAYLLSLILDCYLIFACVRSQSYMYLLILLGLVGILSTLNFTPLGERMANYPWIFEVYRAYTYRPSSTLSTRITECELDKFEFCDVKGTADIGESECEREIFVIPGLASLSDLEVRKKYESARGRRFDRFAMKRTIFRDIAEIDYCWG
ncbi:hypothetical protein SAMN05519103_03879 [Rhizobiales bacterium GAS113]|nr:hypothetical protein SAMN05519103_03879 [Rhizobiales bacterium GAS113]